MLEKRYKLQVHQKLRYQRASEEPAEYVDGLLNFRYIAQFPGAGAFQLERGINTPAPVRDVQGVKRRPAILIASSPHKRGTEETPWQDFFDTDNGHIRYFGDNKSPGQDPATTPGNKALLNAFRLAHSHDKQDRLLTPPLLFFRRVSHEGRTKGFPEFQGFGVIRSVDLLTQWDNKQDRSFTNYAFDFVVLSMEAEHESFDWDWIQRRRNSRLTLLQADECAPASWRKWVRTGAVSLDKLRRRVSKLSIKPAEDQKPTPGTSQYDILQEVYKYYEGKKHRFEALAEVIAERVVGADYGIYRRGWITTASGDRGVDFVASVKLGSGFSATDLIVLGQAKCESPNSPTSGVHIARTVARLQRGWVGVYVTTSYFSEPVQQEVIEDRHPIVLIHGKRLAQEVSEIIHDSDRYESVSDFLNELDAEYKSRIKQRRPGELMW